MRTLNGSDPLESDGHRRGVGSDLTGYWDQLQHYIADSGVIPTEYVLCSNLGPLLRIAYPDAPLCSRCCAPVFVAPSNTERVVRGETIVCGKCHSFPGFLPDWNIKRKLKE